MISPRRLVSGFLGFEEIDRFAVDCRSCRRRVVCAHPLIQQNPLTRLPTARSRVVSRSSSRDTSAVLTLDRHLRYLSSGSSVPFKRMCPGCVFRFSSPFFVPRNFAVRVPQPNVGSEEVYVHLMCSVCASHVQCMRKTRFTSKRVFCGAPLRFMRNVNVDLLCRHFWASDY